MPEKVILQDATNQNVQFRVVVGRDKVRTWRNVAAGDRVDLTNEEIRMFSRPPDRIYTTNQIVVMRRILHDDDDPKNEAVSGYRLLLENDG